MGEQNSFKLSLILNFNQIMSKFAAMTIDLFILIEKCLWLIYLSRNKVSINYISKNLYLKI